jgi:hypothetical protein
VLVLNQHAPKNGASEDCETTEDAYTGAIHCSGFDVDNVDDCAPDELVD